MYKITTMTLSNSFNTCINLINIGLFLKIDQDIIGIKYHFGNKSFCKGVYYTFLSKRNKIKTITPNKKSFYNQATLIVNINNHNVNVKLFQNGALHMTGCKQVDECDSICKLLVKKFISLEQNVNRIILVKDVNGIKLDTNSFIFNNLNEIVGYYDKVYHINDQAYKPVKNEKENRIVLISETIILDTNLNEIGKITKKRKYQNKSFNYLLNENYKFTTELSNIEIIKYHCNIFKDDKRTKKFNDTNICAINACFDFQKPLNRQYLYDLCSSKFICIYNPDRYAGLKIILKLKNETVSICICNNKCTCDQITLLIFSSGKIIITGAKSIEIIDIITKYIHKMF